MASGASDVATQPALEVGLLLPSREVMLSEEAGARPLLELGRAAEQVGFDSLWAGDSLLARPRLEPLSLLCALAAQTTRVRLGTAVLLAPLRHPLLLAHQLATLDRLCDGRLIVGLGSGFPYPGTEAEFRAVGIPFNQRAGRLVEAVKLWRVLWNERDGEAGIGFEGRYWHLQDVLLEPKPYRLGGPPLWLAGEGKGALRRAGSLFDGWLPYSPTAAVFAERWAAVRGAAAEAGRADPAAALYVTVALDDERARAQERLERYVQTYYGFPLDVMSQLQAFYGGDVDGCAEWLSDYLDAGVRHLVIRIGVLEGHRHALDRIGELLAVLRSAIGDRGETAA